MSKVDKKARKLSTKPSTIVVRKPLEKRQRDRYDNHIKKYINRTVAACLGVQTGVTGDIAYLESEEMVTTHTLLHCNGRNGATLIPVTKDKINFRLMPDMRGAVEPKSGMLWLDFVHDCADIERKLKLAWADYMCNFPGSGKIRPPEDIRAMFSARIFSSGAFLALTLQQNNRGPIMPDFKERRQSNDPDNIQEFVCETGRQYGYDVKPWWVEPYRSEKSAGGVKTPMILLIFEISDAKPKDHPRQCTTPQRRSARLAGRR